MEKKLGIVRDDVFLGHEAPGYHPECPDRLIAVGEALDSEGLSGGARIFPARPATTEELGRVHDPRYVKSALAALQRGSGFFDGDTYFCEGTEAAALGAAGGCIDAAIAMHRGEVDVVMAVPRPPGHHATRTRAGGFCVFNNVAVAAGALLAEGVERLLIVDWDVHHGNGTQDIFYRDPRVLFVSLHLWPHYPGSGASDEIGEGPGRGFTANVPLPHGAGNADALVAMERLVEPLAASFRPQRVLASTGFDGHRDDPLGGMRLDEDGFHALGAKLQDIAARTADGRVMMVLEGGYNLRALATSVVAAVRGAIRGDAPRAADAGAAAPRATAAVDRTIDALRPFWSGSFTG
ncbi:MAG: histone deacetylase [Myxococcota bacterium]|nr:histone deacetylase [Myxococcota bacterium]